MGWIVVLEWLDIGSELGMFFFEVSMVWGEDIR